jgi:hypothetical protein
MASQPVQKEVCSALHELCSKTIVDIEIQLELQRKSDIEEAKKEVEKRMVAEREKKEKEEKIQQIERELRAMRGADSDRGIEQPMQYMSQTAGGEDEDEDEDREDEEPDSGSAVEEPQVRRHTHIYKFYAHYNDYLRQETSKKKPKQQQEEARNGLEQIVHSAVSPLTE